MDSIYKEKPYYLLVLFWDCPLITKQSCLLELQSLLNLQNLNLYMHVPRKKLKTIKKKLKKIKA